MFVNSLYLFFSSKHIFLFFLFFLLYHTHLFYYSQWPSTTLSFSAVTTAVPRYVFSFLPVWPVG